ncbi:hypothetical protein HDU98_000795 [Podochytrium sp. JEL0797]|nr:hypothetical protein HDU98_000795 [Podochytrium sp. JEL0797]
MNDLQVRLGSKGNPDSRNAKKIPAELKAASVKVDIAFQNKAWMDSQVMCVVLRGHFWIGLPRKRSDTSDHMGSELLGHGNDMSVVSPPPPPFDAENNNNDNSECAAPKPSPEDNHKSPPVSPHEQSMPLPHPAKPSADPIAMSLDSDPANKHCIPLTAQHSANPPQPLPSASAAVLPATQHAAKQLKPSPSTSSAPNNSLVPTTPPAKLHEVVFVDPDEPDAPWWWPAIVVPQKELSEFRKSVNLEIKDPEVGEYLVCYFEDGSFSTIPKDDAMPFHPQRHPYTTYLQSPDGPKFRLDNAVSLATDYFENGVVPPSFLWLNGGYLSASAAPGSAGGLNGDIVVGMAAATTAAVGQHPVLPSPSTGGKKRTQGDKRSSNASRKEAGQGGEGKKKARRENVAGGASGSGEKDKHRKQQPHQIIVGSSGYASSGSLVCGVCGKPMGTCACSGSGASGGAQILHHFQPLLQQHQQDVYQVGALQYSTAGLHPPNLSRSASTPTTMGYYTHRPVVASFEGAGSGSVGAGNPFAPICVLKRSERPEWVMLKGLVPVGRRRLVKEVLGRVVRGGGVHK